MRTLADADATRVWYVLYRALILYVSEYYMYMYFVTI
jgi:hypothetical protein